LTLNALANIYSKARAPSILSRPRYQLSTTSTPAYRPDKQEITFKMARLALLAVLVLLFTSASTVQGQWVVDGQS
jgi:hypothetical protein